MRSILLSKNIKKLTSVYSEELCKRLEISASLDGRMYTEEDILSTPDAFLDVDYIFSTWGMPALDRETIRRVFPSLKCVFYAAGSVQAFARPFLECGVRVFSAWAANGVPVAEYTVAQIVLANKGFFSNTRRMRERDLQGARTIKQSIRGSFGARVGIIGVGMIGSMVAQRLKDYNLEVLAFDPFLPKEKAEALGIRLTTLEEIFSTCYTVTNHLANNEQTQGMLGYEHFSKMIPYATFLNTGRGAQVREDDLARALAQRPDLTAVLDVTYPEPCAEGHPFYSLENCFLTSHIAGSLGDEVRRMAEYMEEEFLLLTSGGAVRYEVTPKMLETMA